MNFWWKFFIIMLAITFCIAGGWMARGWYEGAKQSKELTATINALQKAQEQINVKSGAYEAERAKNASLSAVLRQKEEVSRAKEPVASGCVIPPSGMQLTAEAVKAGNTR